MPVATEMQVSRHSLTARYLVLFGGEMMGKVAVMAAFAYLARVLTPADFGRIELSLSVTLFFVIAVEGGLGPYGARLIAAEPSRTPQLLAQVIVLRALLAVPAYAIIAVLSARYGMPGLGILAVYGLTVLLIPLYNPWVFQGFGRMRWVAAGTALRYGVFAAMVFLMVRPGSDPRLVPAAEVAGVIALVLLNLVGRRFRLRVPIDWRNSLRGALKLFPESWPLAASQIASVALWYFPEILLGLRSTPVQVAWMAGSLRIVLAVHTFVSLYFFNMLPGLSAAFAQSDDEGRALARRSLATSMWIGCLLAGTMAILAPAIVTTLYGQVFYQSAMLLQIGIWMVPIGWLAGHYRYVLIATGHQKLEFLAAGATAVVTIVLCRLFIERGSEGSLPATLALVSGGLVNVVMSGLATRRTVGSLGAVRALLEPVGIAVVALVSGLILRSVVGPLAAAAVAFGAYALLAAYRDPELVRLRGVWLRGWS